jgi:ABC-type sugar transport system substrate-binding protein
VAGVRGRIGLFIVSEHRPYQRLQAEDARRAAERLGVELEVFSGEDTAIIQSTQIVKFLHAHPEGNSVVMVIPVSDIGHEVALQNLARKALGRGIGWMVLNRNLQSHVLQMRREFPALPVGLVAVDNHDIGRTQGQQVARMAGTATPSVLYVVGNVNASTARDRRAGLLEVLNGRANIAEVEALWSSASAEKVVSHWLDSQQDRHVDVLAAQTDGMALGALEALKRAARERKRPEWARVPAFGVDGLATEGQRLVNDKVLTATIVMPPTAGRAVELVARAWEGTPPPAKLILQAKPYPAEV